MLEETEVKFSKSGKRIWSRHPFLR